MRKPLTIPELLDMRSVLERARQRIDTAKTDAAAADHAEHHAEQLAEAIRDINVELNGRIADEMGANV